MKLPYNIDSVAKQITVKSAVNPSLWACVVVSIPTFILAIYTDNIILIMLFCFIGFIPIGLFSISYIYFMLKNPDFLRSEEYQLKANSLKLLGDKDNPLQADATDVVAMINNPSLPPPKQEKNDE